MQLATEDGVSSYNMRVGGMLLVLGVCTVEVLNIFVFAVQERAQQGVREASLASELVRGVREEGWRV